jgi:FkbM family methyltransferase
MIPKIIDKIIRIIELRQLRIFSHILKKYDVEFYYKDRLGILTKREHDDNFYYMFNTHNSCDAVPLMVSLNERISNSNIGIDVGANIGITTIWMSKHCKKVYSFEPEKKNIERFKENMAVNFITNFELIQQAVSDVEGKTTLNVLESYGHHSLGKVKTSQQVGIQEVLVTTLDKYCSKNNIKHIDFLKVDVEGFEIEVFRGARSLFLNKNIKLVAFELSEIPLKSLNKKEDEIFNFLEEVHYDVFYMDGEKFDVKNHSKITHLDLIASPKE